MKSYDAIVIGAGIAGLSVARELAKLKQRVLLLEKGPMGGKASRAAAGILDPYTEASEETPLLTLGLEALNFYPTLIQEIKDKVSAEVEYEKLGILYLAITTEDEKLLKNRFEWQKKKGLPVKAVSGSEAQKLEPVISKKAQSGIYYPEIAKLNAGKLITALFELARFDRVEIETGAKEVSPWMVGNEIRGVQLSSDRFESPKVVMATGCWEGFEERLGFKINVSPIRGQILLLRGTSPRFPKHILHTPRWAYIVPWPGKRLLIGSTLESAGYNDGVTEAGKEDILKRVSEIMKEIPTLSIESSWAGLRPFIKGGLPLVGPTAVHGLYLATGYYRSGILIGPLVGKLMAEGIVSGKFSPLLQPFNPSNGKKLEKAKS